MSRIYTQELVNCADCPSLCDAFCDKLKRDIEDKWGIPSDCPLPVKPEVGQRQGKHGNEVG